MSLSFPSPVRSINPPLYCRRLSSAERARLSHAQATFLMELGPFLSNGFHLPSSEFVVSELASSFGVPRVVSPPLGALLFSSEEESLGSSPSPLLGRKSTRAAELLIIGRETTNSVCVKFRDRVPSKDTKNSVSGVFDNFSFLDEKLVPKAPFFPVTIFFEPIKNFGSIKFLLGINSIEVVGLSLLTIAVGTPLISSYKLSELSESHSQHTDFFDFSSS